MAIRPRVAQPSRAEPNDRSVTERTVCKNILGIRPRRAQRAEAGQRGPGRAARRREHAAAAGGAASPQIVRDDIGGPQKQMGAGIAANPQYASVRRRACPVPSTIPRRLSCDWHRAKRSGFRRPSTAVPAMARSAPLRGPASPGTPFIALSCVACACTSARWSAFRASAGWDDNLGDRYPSPCFGCPVPQSSTGFHAFPARLATADLRFCPASLSGPRQGKAVTIG